MVTLVVLSPIIIFSNASLLRYDNSHLKIGKRNIKTSRYFVFCFSGCKFTQKKHLLLREVIYIEFKTLLVGEVGNHMFKNIVCH